MAVEMNKYIVKGNKKAESWQLRSSEVDILINGKNRRLRYCKNEPSIYEDEQSEKSTTDFIWFTYGALLVNPADKTKNAYIQAHPDFNKRFYLHNEQADATAELVELELEDETRLMLKELDKEQKEAVATVLYGLNVVSRWSEEKIAVECYHFLKRNPKRLQEVINDPATELIYLTSAAIKLGVIEISTDKTAIRWADTHMEIIPIPRGVNPLTEMSQFLRTTDGLVTLQEIGDRVNAKKGKKVVKSTTTTKAKAK